MYALKVYSSEIEGKDSTPHNNDTRSVAYVSKINGYAINDNGLTSKKNWKGMTDDQREVFLTSRKIFTGRES